MPGPGWQLQEVQEAGREIQVQVLDFLTAATDADFEPNGVF